MLAAGTAWSRFSIFSVLVQYGAPESEDNENKSMKEQPHQPNEGRTALLYRKGSDFLLTLWIIFMLGKYFQKSGPDGLAEGPQRGCLLGYAY